MFSDDLQNQRSTQLKRHPSPAPWNKMHPWNSTQQLLSWDSTGIINQSICWRSGFEGAVSFTYLQGKMQTNYAHCLFASNCGQIARQHNLRTFITAPCRFCFQSHSWHKNFSCSIPRYWWSSAKRSFYSFLRTTRTRQFLIERELTHICEVCASGGSHCMVFVPVRSQGNWPDHSEIDTISRKHLVPSYRTLNYCIYSNLT